MKDSKMNRALQILADGGMLGSDNFGQLYANQAEEESEYLKDKKTSVFTRIGAGVGAVAAGVGGVLAAPFTGGASIAAAVPLVTSLGKHAIGGKPERGQDNDPLAELGGDALGGLIGAAGAYAGAGGFGNVGGGSGYDVSQLIPEEIPNSGFTGDATFYAKCGGKMYANGGSTSFTTTEQGNGLITLNGKTHEDGGIDLMEGIEVEGGETIYNDFVFTNSHTITFPIAKKYNLPQGSIGKTFAAASKHYSKYLDERPDDPYAKESFAEHMSRLEEAHLEAVPQSRPENIPVTSIMSNALSEGVPAKNGGKIMWYVNSVPFKSGGNIKYADGGINPPDEDPLLVDKAYSDQAYEILDQVLRNQFGPARVTSPDIRTMGVDGLPGIEMPQYERGMNQDMLRIRNMSDIRQRNQAIADVWNAMNSRNLLKTDNLSEDTVAGLQKLDFLGSGYPLRFEPNSPVVAQNPTQPTTEISPTDPPRSTINPNGWQFTGLPNEPITANPGITGPIQPNQPNQPVIVNPTQPTVAGPTQPIAEIPFEEPEFNEEELNFLQNFQPGISNINPLSPFNNDPAQIQRQPGLTPEQIAESLSSSNKLIRADSKEVLDELDIINKVKGAINTSYRTNIDASNARRAKADAAKTLRNSKLMEGMRYAPIAGDLAALITTGLSKPEKIAAEQFLIKQDYKKQHIDKELLQREVDQQTADLTYQLSGLATTQAGLMGALSSISSGTAKAKTDAVMKGQLFDAEQGQMAEQYGRQKEMANAQTMLQVQNMNDANMAAWSDNLSDSITNLTQNVGAIGKDEMNKNIANRLGAYNIYGQFINPEMAPVTDILGLIGNLNETQRQQVMAQLSKKKSTTTDSE